MQTYFKFPPDRYGRTLNMCDHTMQLERDAYCKRIGEPSHFPLSDIQHIEFEIYMSKKYRKEFVEYLKKIGGLSNAKNKSYAICFFHEDKVTGNLWVIIKGKNQAGITLTWAVDSGTVIEPEFKALPHDSEGTLIQLIEELNVTKYVKTSDTDVVSGKDYYTRTGSKEPYTYIKVENPTKADISTYYEIDNN